MYCDKLRLSSLAKRSRACLISALMRNEIGPVRRMLDTVDLKQPGAPGALGFEVCSVANTARGELSIPQGRYCAS